MNEEISKNILKSGTSIVGIVCKDGVVMAGDRRSTAGGGNGPGIVIGKNKLKIRKINDYLIAAYTGSVSDIELTNKVIAAELKLLHLRTKSRPTVEEAANLLGNIVYRNIRAPSMVPSIVGTLAAGIDENGEAKLFSIEPAGSAQEVDTYDANFSSGMPYMLGLLEGEYNKEISVKEGIELAKKTIKAGMERDPASGNGFDIFTLSKSGIQHVISEDYSKLYK
jgi:proteasome beta subunit